MGQLHIHMARYMLYDTIKKKRKLSDGQELDAGIRNGYLTNEVKGVRAWIKLGSKRTEEFLVEYHVI